tara:strand:+ start:142 stop:378 length:237 start_codon:yes stop_codon:yes gene_type:complete
MVKYLYIVDYWIPFPQSEYGGTVSVIASDDTEVYSILHSEEQFHDGHEDCLYHNIKQSQKYELKDESLESGIVDAFVT